MGKVQEQAVQQLNTHFQIISKDKNPKRQAGQPASQAEKEERRKARAILGVPDLTKDKPLSRPRPKQFRCYRGQRKLTPATPLLN